MTANRASFIGIVAFSLAAGLALGYWFRGDLATSAKPASFAKTQLGHLRRLDANSAAGRIVFLGGSTFQGFDISVVTPIGLNLSLGGDTLPSLIERASGYRALATARGLFIHIGLNDLLQNCTIPTLQVESLFALVPAQAPILILGVQGIQGSLSARLCGGASTRLVSDLNRVLMKACAGNANCQFVPNPVAPDATAGAVSGLQEPDGIHLSRQGYAILGESLRRALAGKDISLAATPRD